MPTASISSMKTMHWPPHLRASFFALRARKRTISASMPMKVWAKPEPGIETNGELNPVAIAFASIVLPVPGAPRKSKPRSRLPPARSNASPDCHKVTMRRTSSFASAWPRTCSSFTPPLGVAGLVPADLRDAHQHHRAHEDEEVRGEEEEDDDDLHPERTALGQGAHLREDVSRAAPPRHRGAGLRAVEAVEERERDETAEIQRDAEVEAPRPRAAAVDDVLLAEARVLGAEETRPRDQAADDEVDDPAERDHADRGDEDRLARAHADLVVEPEIRRRAREHGHERGDAGQLAQLRSEGERFLA